MYVNLIWAQDSRGAIGKSNTLPWHLPEDLARFRALTLNHAVLMGRRTWDSLPRKPLPQRRNIVMSSTMKAEDLPEDVFLANSVDEALLLGQSTDGRRPVFVIGGEQVYRALIHLADRVYVTEVDTTVEGADAFAPAMPAGMKPESIGAWQSSSSGLRYRYVTYCRQR